MAKNVGFVSFRIAGTDGVSLETRKWAQILTRNGYSCHYFAGALDAPEEVSLTVPEAHFTHPEIRKLHDMAFSRPVRPPELTAEIHRFREILKRALYEFVHRYHIDLLIPENALAIPLNIPLGMALTELIAETGIATIAHHHDFFWERPRFLHNCVWDYLNQCFPPHLPSIRHVVINSSGVNQLALRTGVASTRIPNVMEFEKPAPGIDEYNADVWSALGLAEEERFILQPTRVVQRKGIEHAIELVARLQERAALVISHAAGDEGHEYEERVRDYAELLNVRALFVSDIIGESRGTTEDGRKVYALQDVYPHADLVTYPSITEGFGNAFLEAVYFRKPILINNYPIYSYDIRPLGFDVVEMDGFITDDTIRRTQELLADPGRVRAMTDHNYDLALEHFGYAVLEKSLLYLATSTNG